MQLVSGCLGLRERRWGNGRLKVLLQPGAE